VAARAQDAHGLSREFASISWTKVTDRQNSSVEIPTSLVSKTNSAVGLMFQNQSDGIKIYFNTTTESRPGFPGNDPKGDMNLKRSDCDVWPPEFVVTKRNLAAYSCIKHDVVHYYVAKYNGYGDVMLYVQYPVAKRSLWDKVVSKMAMSLHQTRRLSKNP